MWAARCDEGYVFGDLTPDAVKTLKGIPMLIESSDPRVRSRLLPETCQDSDDELHWQQHAVPELERLFLSRAQLVRRDLDNLRLLPNSSNSVLLIPDEHQNAWIAALNAARLAMYVLSDLTAEQMEAKGFAGATDKQQQAVLRIGLLAEFQAILLGEYRDDYGGDDDDEGDGLSFDDLILG